MDMSVKRCWGFGDLEPGMFAWLGTTPSEYRIHCGLRKRTASGGIDIGVLNGGWGGTLYEQEVTYENGEVSNFLYIVDDRGTRHEPVYIVDAGWPTKSEHDDAPSEVPF